MKVWEVLNAPLVVVIIAILIWPMLTVLSGVFAIKLGIAHVMDTVKEEISEPFSSVDSSRNEKLLKNIAVIKAVEISNISHAPANWSGRAKIIGTLTNHSRETISDIKITASFYNQDKLINVNEERLSSIKVLEASKSANFSFHTKIEDGEDFSAYRIELVISDLSII